jgi:UPF0755 protein
MPKAIRFFWKFLSFVIALILTLIALVLLGAAHFNSPPEKPPSLAGEGIQLEDNSLLFEVRNGETANSVGNRLENSGVIRNRYFWHLLFRLNKDYVKTGTYKIELPASQIKIRSILTSGEQILVKVTIPEGVTLKKMARILEEAGICETGDFLSAAYSGEMLNSYHVSGSSMEGYLYPDTYFFPLGYPASKVVQTMADTFYVCLWEIAGENTAEYRTANSAEINNRVIIASIVEREYRIPDEAALMAGVFYNRLKIGMALQSCATVEYVITEILNRPHPEQLFNRDLEIRDPYNTYMRPGLPPGPISAPGKTALMAAFNPASTDYLYFRLTDSEAGRHYFSRTLDDHIRAGTLYLKGR